MIAPTMIGSGGAPQGDFSGFAQLVDSAQARSQNLIGSAAQQLSLQNEQGRRSRAKAEAAQPGYSDAMASWGPQAAPTPNDNWAAEGFGSNVPRSLIDTESGGNFQATNDVEGSGGKGHFGVVQFSQARIREAIDAGAIPEMSPEQFTANNQAQVAATNWHFNDIDGYIQDRGLGQYIGQDIGGTPLTINSLRAMAHLGGRAGMMRYLESNGQYNPADAYGTSLSDYAARHAGLMKEPSPRARPQG